jgi:hypothetical protein
MAPLVLRMTSDQAGHVHGLSIGAGATLDSALEELDSEAQRQAGELARELQPDDTQPDAEWRFEVADVRSAPAVAGAGLASQEHRGWPRNMNRGGADRRGVTVASCRRSPLPVS